MVSKLSNIGHEVQSCTLCAARFALTATAHSPKPIVWFRSRARLLIAGQAPGARVHESGRPFTDPSGDRLRDWLGLDLESFYDRDKVAIVPMAFCFPGYNAKGADLPPPKICAETWRERVLSTLTNVRLTVVVGGAAQNWHLGTRMPVTERVRSWRDHAPRVFVLPHPSWRNTGWLRANPWFDNDVIPALRAQVAEVMKND